MLKQFREDYGEAWKSTDWFAIVLIYLKMGIGWIMDFIRFLFNRFILGNKNYDFISPNEYSQMCWDYIYDKLFED